MLISLAGSQGIGKTTTLEDLKSMGYRVIENKTARSILKEWDMSLESINENRDLVLKFQNEIIERHYNNNKDYINSEEIVLQERSYIDIFVYALFQLSQYNRYNDWFYEYYNKCMELQKTYKATIYLMGNPNFFIENDAVRSTNLHFSNAINTMMLQYLGKFDNVIYVNTMDRNERISLIKHELELIRLGV